MDIGRLLANDSKLLRSNLTLVPGSKVAVYPRASPEVIEDAIILGAGATARNTVRADLLVAVDAFSGQTILQRGLKQQHRRSPLVADHVKSYRRERVISGCFRPRRLTGKIQRDSCMKLGFPSEPVRRWKVRVTSFSRSTCCYT